MFNPALNFALLLLTIVGVNPQKNKYIVAFLITLHFVIVGGMCVLSLLEMILTYDGIPKFMISLDMVTDYFIFMGKLVSYVFNMKNIIEIIQFPNLLPISYSGKPIEQKLKKFLNKIKAGFYIMEAYGLVLLILAYLTPVLFSKKRNLPLNCCTFINFLKSPLYEILFIWQFYCSFTISFFVCGVDFLFMSFLMTGYCQIQMLKYELNNLKLEVRDFQKNELKYYIKVKKLVQVHNNIIKYFYRITKVFSSNLLVEFIGSFLNLCLSVYTVAVSNDPNTIMRYIITFIINAFMLLLFCASGTLITSAYNSIDNSIYFSKWYLGASTSPRIRKSILLIMKMSQKQFVIKGGGVVTLDMETYSQIIKTSYSLYAVLKTFS